MNKTYHDSPYLLLSINRSVGDGAVDQHILPDGLVRSLRGDDFIVDAESAKLMIEAFRRKPRSLLFDYEHQSLGGQYAAPDGKAKAAGWIEDLRYEPNVGIIASVKWTETAQQEIRNDQYRYQSPVLLVRKSDRRAIELRSVAVTNAPAIDSIPLLVAKDNQITKETTTMADQPNDPQPMEQDVLMVKLSQVIQAFDLGVDASEGPAAVLDALLTKAGGKTKDAAPSEAATQEASSIRDALNLSDKATCPEVVASINKLSGHVGYVSADDHRKVMDRLATLENGETQRVATEAVETCINSGQLNPHDGEKMAWAKKLARDDVESFRMVMKGAPVVCPPGRIGDSAAPDGRTGNRDRMTIINSAAKEFSEGNDQTRLTSVEAFVNLELRDSGMVAMSNEEKNKLVTV